MDHVKHKLYLFRIALILLGQTTPPLSRDGSKVIVTSSVVSTHFNLKWNWRRIFSYNSRKREEIMCSYPYASSRYVALSACYSDIRCYGQKWKMKSIHPFTVHAQMTTKQAWLLIHIQYQYNNIHLEVPHKILQLNDMKMQFKWSPIENAFSVSNVQVTFKDLPRQYNISALKAPSMTQILFPMDSVML